MATPVKNTCTPGNIWGGFDQTMFLGCSVMSFSASAGWNEQQSEITVQVVEDTCAPPAGSPKKYFDTDLTEQDWTIADPGFFGLTTNIIGAPVYFRVGDFEFAGQVQSWEESHSISGNPTYQIKIVDPRAILDNAQIIINEYAGSVGSVYNLINAFGYMETFGVSCPETFQSAPGVYSAGDGSVDGTVFGSPAEFYGGADVNHNGMQWNQILSAQRILLSSFPATTNIWSPYGRLAFKAPSSFPASGMGIMPADVGNLAYYFLDLNELPTAPTYWRFNGVSTSIMDTISQITQDSGHDYYIELVPVVGGVLGSGIHKFIKIRTADRVNAPALNSIDTFVASADRKVISYNKGRELRNDITQAFVVGGPKNSFYQAEQSDDPEGDGQPVPPEADDMIIPYFGLNPNTGNAIVPELDGDGWWFFDAFTDDLAIQLVDPKYNRAIAATLEIGEDELVAAQSGYDIWLSFAANTNTELYQALVLPNLKGAVNIQGMVKIIKNLGAAGGNALRAADFLPAANAPKANDVDMQLEVAQIGFKWIKKIADTHYGKTYQVRLPFTCGRTDSESGLIQLSEQPNEGGWTEVSPVLELAHPGILTDFFTLDDNRLGAFSRFDNVNGVTSAELSTNDYISTAGKLWVKLGVNEEYVYLDKSTLFSPRAIVTLPTPIKNVSLDNPDIAINFAGLHKLLQNFKGAVKNNNIADAQENFGLVLLALSAVNRAETPDACGFGIKSNILSYGPWGAAGAVGGVQVTHDDGLVPWEYGGFTTLNLAGNATASEGITNQQVAEEGQVTVIGSPDLPLGAELLAADSGNPFNGGLGANLVENRTSGTAAISGIDYYFTAVLPWDGTYGPNITGLTTAVGPEGLQTTYNLRTWTPKYGRFFRGNAERMKKVGRQRLNFNKQLRAFGLHRLRNQNIDAINKAAGKAPGVLLEPQKNLPNTAHEVFGGQIIPWNSGEYDRSLVGTVSVAEASTEMAAKYEEKALMSMDGLLRPISTATHATLPTYANPTSNCQKTVSRGAQPPIDIEGEAGSYNAYNLDIDINYLDPFSNPTGLSRSSVADDRTDTPTVGHDIEMIGRGTGVPPSSIVMPIQGYGDTQDITVSDHNNTYRGMAIRGPMIMQGWGYDLDGFPVPNKVDSEGAAGSGNFAETNLEHKFMDDFLRKSKSWPVGPVDFRWDRARAVWTIPQFRSLVGTLQSDIDPLGSGVASQTSGPTLYDSGGSPIATPQFMAVDKVGYACMKSGDVVIAEFDPYECEYSIISHKSNTQMSSETFCFDETNAGFGYLSPSGHLTLQNYTTLNFGKGFRIDPQDDDICVVDIQAGFHPDVIAACVTGTPDSTRLASVLKAGNGIRMQTPNNSCDAWIGAGINMSNSTSCVSSSSPAGFVSTLVYGKGLNLNQLTADGCQAEVGVYMDIGGISGAAEISLGACLQATDLGSCNIELDFKDKFQDYSMSGIEQPIIDGMSVQCSPSGLVTITATRKVLIFNNCGQMVDIVPTGDLTLPAYCE